MSKWFGKGHFWYFFSLKLIEFCLVGYAHQHVSVFIVTFSYFNHLRNLWVVWNQTWRLYVHWMVLYDSYLKFNMAVWTNNVFWLTEI
jgi:hypothetical protein